MSKAEEKLSKAVKLADAMYYAAQQLTTDASHLKEAMEKWWQFKNVELKESEDERVRERIIALVNAHGQGMYKGDMLAWLEKQGEQKPQRMVSAEAKEALYGKPSWSEDDEIVEEIIDFLDEYTGSVKPPSLSYPVKSKWCTWLKSLKQRIGGEQ